VNTKKTIRRSERPTSRAKFTVSTNEVGVKKKVKKRDVSLKEKKNKGCVGLCRAGGPRGGGGGGVGGGGRDEVGWHGGGGGGGGLGEFCVVGGDPGAQPRPKLTSSQKTLERPPEERGIYSETAA